MRLKAVAAELKRDEEETADMKLCRAFLGLYLSLTIISHSRNFNVTLCFGICPVDNLWCVSARIFLALTIVSNRVTAVFFLSLDDVFKQLSVVCWSFCLSN